MAYDIFLGRTGRDWCCGSGPADAPPTDVTTQAQVEDLARTTNSEIVKTTNLAIGLDKARQLPKAEYEPFKQFHKKWLSFMEGHRRGYRIRDSLALWNFRRLDERFRARFDIFARVAATPIRKPDGPTGTEIRALDTGVSDWSWGMPLVMGAALAGAIWLTKQPRKTA
jgi:hypothetical protein